MSQKCVHKGCGQRFTDPAESPCHYHPGPPIFHEGLKGWQCCTKRVLTFDEFLSIPPCTTGQHSAVDDTPTPPPSSNAKAEEPVAPVPVRSGIPQQFSTEPLLTRLPIGQPPPRATPSPKPPEDTDSDDASVPIPTGQQCRRRGCNGTYEKNADRDGEKCVFHPGAPVFHEGSKGYTCCKRRVLEFDQFLRIEGCTTKDRHLFVGSGKVKEKKKEEGQDGEKVRCDFYQTTTQVIASFYLKKIDKAASSVEFVNDRDVQLRLKTEDGKNYEETVELFGPIDPEKSKFRFASVKLELTLVKADGTGWPVLKATDRHTGEIIQSGRAGFA